MNFKLTFTILMLLCFGQMSGQNCDILFEDFTGSSPSNPPNGWDLGPGGNIGNSFPSGDTLDPAVGFNNGNGIIEYIISPPLTCPDSVCFLWHASGLSSNWDVAIQYTQDTTGGGVWTDLFVIDLTGSGSPNTYQQLCLDVPNDDLLAPFDVYFRWIMIQRTSGTFYLDNVCINSGTCTTKPTQLTFSGVTNACKEANLPISIQVCATDVNGFVADTYSGNIDLDISSGPGTIIGTDFLPTTNGCANFSVSFTEIGSYELMAATDTLAGTSETFLIEADCPLLDTLRIMSYNILNFPDGRDDCGDLNTVVPARWDTLSEIVEYAQADVVMVCELQNETGSNNILSALQAGGSTNWLAANYVPNQSSVVQNLNNMFYYNADKMTLISQHEILTSTRDFNKYTVYINDPALAPGSDTTWIDFYMCHLKAGSFSADSQRRADDCLILRNYMDAQPTQRNFILGGDMNFYTDQEAAYQTLLSGTYPFIDPVNAPGAWNGDPAFAPWHSQSTRPTMDPNLRWDCGFNGGLDSRFDFLLNSSSVQNGTMNVTYIPNTYQPYLNEGNLYKKGINDPVNTLAAPAEIVNALFYMSDHLPIVEDLEVQLIDVALAFNDLHFTAAQEGLDVKLRWKSNADQSDYYLVERSTDGLNFQKIAKAVARKSGQYSHLDSDLIPGQYYYRITEVLKDGEEILSEVKPIHFKGELVAMTIFPNPTDNQLHVRFTGRIIDPVEVTVFDQLGRIVVSEQISSSYYFWDIADLPSGVYFVQANFNNYQLRQKLIKL